MKKRGRPAQGSEDMYRAILSGVVEGILVADAATREFLYANPAVCAMLGYSEAELLRLGLADIHPQDCLARVKTEFEAQGRGEKVMAPDIPCVRKDGSIIYADIKGSAVVIAGRACTLGFFTEVTSRQRAEQALQESEARFRQAFDFAGIGMALLSPDGRWLRTNRALREMLGYGEEAFLRTGFRELTHPEDLPDNLAQVRRLMAGEIPFMQVEKRYRHRDGHYVWARLNVSVVRSADGKPLCTVAQIEDISRRKQAEEDQKLALSLLQATLESTADAILVVDREGRVSSWNERFLELWGMPKALAAAGDDARLLDFAAGQLAPPEGFLDKVRSLYAQPEADSFDTLYFKDGRVVERYSQAQRLDGKVVGRVWSFREVTDRVRAEAERGRLLDAERKARAETEAANKAKDDFLAIVSHELRTPLTAIQGWAWLLRSGKLPPEEGPKAFDVILRNVQVQRQIVEDLIDVSSLARGRFHLRCEPLELGAVVHAACDSLAQLARDRRIGLIRRTPGPVGVMGDPGRLQQVIWNLLHNAVRFSPEGGEVAVTLRREGDQAALEVVDRGQGIEPEFLGHLFEPFRQAEDPLIREHGGLGLGLAIAKRIVELHGGSVAAASEGRGRGAVFTVRLPAAAWPPSARVPDALAPAAGEQGLRGLSILVVEDDPDGRLLLEQTLSRFGARVAAAADAAQALARLGGQTPDLLLCDIALRGEDGCALMRKLRARGGALASVPAVAFTALAGGDDRARALAAGFQLYLVKPLDPGQLLDALLALLGRR